MSHTDLYISLRLATSPNRVKNDQWDGEGWYIQAYENEGYSDVLKDTRISSTEAQQIAAAIEAVMAKKGVSVRLVQKIAAASLEVRKRIEKQVATLETTYERLRALKLRLENSDL